MQAYVQRSDLNLAREIAPNGKELLGIVLFSKKFELKHEFLHYQEMPEHTKAVTKYEGPKMKRNAWQKYIFSFSGVSISLRLYSQNHLVSFCQTALARDVGNLVLLHALVKQNSATKLHCTAPFYWCGAVQAPIFLKYQNTRN